MLQQHSQAAHAQPFSKKVDPKFFVQTFLGGGGFNPQNPPSDYGPASGRSMLMLAHRQYRWKGYFSDRDNQGRS